MRDLKLVYKADTKEGVQLEFDMLEEKWGNNWDNLSVYFEYPKSNQKSDLHD